MARRVVVLVIGIIQILIILRIGLLLIDAQRGNEIVRSALDVSQIFVAPFIGILNTSAVRANGSVLDLTAIVAVIGWTILEIVAMWAIDIIRREG